MTRPFNLDPPENEALRSGVEALYQYEKRRFEIFDDPLYPTKLLPEFTKHRLAEILMKAIRGESDDAKPAFLDLRQVREWERQA
jgi:hypothetical protein